MVALAPRVCDDPPVPAVVTGEDESFAVVCYRDEGRWQVELLPERLTEDVRGLLATVAGQVSEVPAIVLVDIGDDFFVAARNLGGCEMLLLSDVTAAAVDPLARQVLEHLDLDIPDDDEMDDVWPAGDLDLFADLGVDAMEVGALLSDLDAYADEQLLALARRLGFGDAFTRVVDVVLR
jgi:putative tRNA adenosine deaminase-associated protein